MKWSVISFQIALQQLSMGDQENANEVEKFDRWRSGSKDASFAVDIPIAKDPSGNPQVRGTSLAGPLRSWLSGWAIPGTKLSEEHRGGRQVVAASQERQINLADVLLGSSPDEREGDKSARRPSAVRVFSVDVAGTPDDGRVRVAIDRRRGSAVPGKLFRRANLRDALVTATLLVDHAQLAASLRDLGIEHRPEDVLACLRTAVAEWSPRLGGLKSAGLGAGEKPKELRSGVADWSTAEALEMLFKSDSSPAYLKSIQEEVCAVELPQWVTRPSSKARELNCSFNLVDCLLIDAELADGPPNNRTVSAETIPGTAWRGILRARCEFILRSLGIGVCESSSNTCGKCPTCLIFGWAPGQQTAQQPRHFGASAGEASRVVISDSPVHRAKGKHLVSMELPHVGIDRFTGGAADSKLFTTTVIVPPAKVTLQVKAADPRRLPPDWAWPLLWMAIRDIDYGLIGVGAATTRGCGTLRATQDVSQQLSHWPEALEELRKDYGEQAVL